MQRKVINVQTGDVTMVDLTAEEVAAKEAREVLVQAAKDAEAAAAAKKVSGKAKLKAGEALNDAELSALFGD
jgi:hypothetical protein